MKPASTSAELRSPVVLAALLSMLLPLAGLLAGCETPVRLMPTPVAFKNGEVDPFEKVGPQLQGTDVPVLYTTNRGVLVERPEPVHTIVATDTLRMGVAHVRIGDGTLDWETLHRLSTTADADERPVVELQRLDQLAVLGAGDDPARMPEVLDFFRLIDQTIAASPSTELLVYVHGSNNTVPRAAAQAAQFRHFTGRRMVVLTYIWPSAGSLVRYFTDVGNAAATVEPFARFIGLLAEHTRASKIDILSYSAGAQVLSPALVKLAQARPGESRAQLRERRRIGQIYFAAPDIDTRRAVDDLNAYVDITERVSIAANLNDSVLVFAQVANRASRAGRPNPTELSSEQSQFLVDASQRLGFDLIKVDPNDIPNLPKRSHDFWFADPWVSSDVLAQFLQNAAPPGRGLEPRATDGGARYWTFPQDFYERVRRLLNPAAKP
ncbi:alpha/beta hydrolase [Rivibacter subsaxonicus]|uniref:Esterase/lipase superfamily enzyme n=1 Tax=Rivibacter subsaxonicus TaxID=457575 RepID=A0A4Q7W0D5_9BURK|nr:alpha/beta hydrolase [Rivibacter subsaxonicus]RZU02627.1 esterase/lipase superfamily enzyme [Rivibacter subsaxonicus]